MAQGVSIFLQYCSSEDRIGSVQEDDKYREICSEAKEFALSKHSMNHSIPILFKNSFVFFSVCEKSVDITPLCNASDLPSHFGLEDHKVDAATMS